MFISLNVTDSRKSQPSHIQLFYTIAKTDRIEPRRVTVCYQFARRMRPQKFKRALLGGID